MIENCKTCKWWEAPTAEFLAWSAEIGHPQTGAWGSCILTETTSAGTCRGESEHGYSLAKADYGTGEWAILRTAPEFGCVQWNHAGKEE